MLRAGDPLTLGDDGLRAKPQVPAENLRVPGPVSAQVLNDIESLHCEYGNTLQRSLASTQNPQPCWQGRSQGASPLKARRR